MLRIDLNPLKAGVHQFELTPTAEAIGLDPERFADLHVGVTLDVAGDRILVLLQATATATLECDRTLVLFEQPIAGTYALLFAPPSFSAGSQEEVEDVRVLLPTDQEIDLTEAVRDTLLLAVPTRCIAPGAEALELPTQFGPPPEEDAIDPRWEALRALRDRDEDA